MIFPRLAEMDVSIASFVSNAQQKTVRVGYTAKIDAFS